eukprot:PhM_4_TR4020/c0_g4_i1/m.47026
MPNCVVNCTFNPPQLKIMGSTLRDETITKLQQRLPLATTTSLNSAKTERKFNFVQNPPHWHLDLGQHFCDQLGRSIIFLTIIECLEAEDWKLRGTNTVVHADNGKDTTKFFFYRA